MAYLDVLTLIKSAGNRVVSKDSGIRGSAQWEAGFGMSLCYAILSSIRKQCKLTKSA